MRTRYRHGIQAKRVALTSAVDYSISIAELRKYGIFTETGGSKTLTLPAAETSIAGIDLLCADVGGGTFKVYVLAGFAGEGALVDTVDVPTNGAVIVYCDGSYWYVVGATPTNA